jgi:hypothetical protein
MVGVQLKDAGRNDTAGGSLRTAYKIIAALAVLAMVALLHASKSFDDSSGLRFATPKTA